MRINIKVESDFDGDDESEVCVRNYDGPILRTENPALAIDLKMEAVINLLRDIESDFGMLEIELQEDNHRVICGALQRRVGHLTDDLENHLTQHYAVAWTVSETFGYMWNKDYKETLFFPALRADLMASSDGRMTEDEIRAEIAEMKRVNQISQMLDGE